jgi:hypothetical protein
MCLFVDFGSLQGSAANSRFHETPQIEVSDDDIGRLGEKVIRGSVFDPSSFTLDPLILGFQPSDITDDRSQWSSTTPESFALKQQCLVLALSTNSSDCWDLMWLTILLRCHMVIRHSRTLVFSYTLLITEHLALGLELEDRGGTLVVDLSAARLRSLTSDSYLHASLIIIQQVWFTWGLRVQYRTRRFEATAFVVSQH